MRISQLRRCLQHQPACPEESMRIAVWMLQGTSMLASPWAGGNIAIAIPFAKRKPALEWFQWNLFQKPNGFMHVCSGYGSRPLGEKTLWIHTYQHVLSTAFLTNVWEALKHRKRCFTFQYPVLTNSKKESYHFRWYTCAHDCSCAYVQYILGLLDRTPGRLHFISFSTSMHVILTAPSLQRRCSAVPLPMCLPAIPSQGWANTKYTHWQVCTYVYIYYMYI